MQVYFPDLERVFVDPSETSVPSFLTCFNRKIITPEIIRLSIKFLSCFRFKFKETDVTEQLQSKLVFPTTSIRDPVQHQQQPETQTKQGNQFFKLPSKSGDRCHTLLCLLDFVIRLLSLILYRIFFSTRNLFNKLV
jgi:hypothetical protein